MESAGRIDCHQLREGLTEYLDEALSPERRQGFDAHLTSCQACRRLLAETRLTIERLASLSGEPMPPAMKRSLLRAFRDTPPGSSP